MTARRLWIVLSMSALLFAVHGHGARAADDAPDVSAVLRELIEQHDLPAMAAAVVEGDRVVAMVTDRDVIARVVAEGRDPNACSVDDVATRELVTARPDQDIEEARQLMAENELDRVLVTEEGDRLVGIISEGDLRAEEGPLA